MVADPGDRTLDIDEVVGQVLASPYVAELLIIDDDDVDRERVRRMLAQVREPLLSVLRISPDFRPAYDPLVHMAMALAQSDVPAARSLLQTLNQIQPARPEASQALHQLTDTAP